MPTLGRKPVSVGLSRSTFLRKLAESNSGQWITYHVGFLFSDRTKNRRLNALANEIWAQYELGTVILVQGRLGDGMYEYFAVKR